MNNTEFLSGNECFTLNGISSPKRVIDFWRWMGLDLNDNLTRAALGEFIVASALGDSIAGERRSGWRVFDILTQYGCKVEVKTSAYRQTWKQRKPSSLVFDVAQKIDWECGEDAPKRHADVYVFCVFNNDSDEVSPLDLNAWDFYVAATADMDVVLGKQKTATLATLKKRLPLRMTGYTGLAMTIFDTYYRNNWRNGWMQIVTLKQYLENPEAFVKSAAAGDYTSVNMGNGQYAVIIDETEWTMLRQALVLCMEHPEWTAK